MTHLNTPRPFPSAGAPNAIPISPLGFGAMGLHAFYGAPKSQSETNAVLDALVANSPQLPVMIDTSDVYTTKPGNGDNERAIGEWIKTNPENRKKIFLATKFAIGPDMKLATSSEDAKKANAASLERLGVEYVDLYYAHRPDRTAGVEDTFQGLKALKEAGKTRFVGCSEYNLEELKQANAIVHVDAYQIEASLWTPQVFANGLAAWCEENGTALVPYSPLGRGLAGRFSKPEEIPDDDFRKHTERMQGSNFEVNMRLVDDIKKIGEKKGATPAQVCLAWLMAQGNNIFPIPGTTNVGRLQENLGSVKVDLSKEEVAQITKLAASFDVKGDRYPEAFKSALAF